MAQFKYSPKQLKFIRESISKINIAHGSVRGGKTFATIIRFVELAITCPDSAIVIIGSSFSSAKTNVVDLILTLYHGYAAWCDKHLILGDKKIRVIGAHDEASIRAITGNTISLAYVDELTTIPWNFIDMLRTRLTHPHSKMIATCNPNSPVHPVKEKLIDCGDPKYCYNLQFEVDDNPVLTEEYKNDLRTKYSGLFYRRYILGEWIAAEGSIYSDFSRSTHVLPRAPHFADNYFCGVDYGIHNAFSALIIGHNNTYSPRFWVEKEFYWDSKKTFRQKLNSELADDLERFIDGYNVRNIALDPSAESFEVELKRRHMRVIQAKNDVYPGLTFVANLVSNHELKFIKDCSNTIGEMEMYVWDSKAAEKGEERPVKKNDHCFAKGTKIQTLRGSIPIERVTTHDRVLTRGGYKSVYGRSHIVKDCSEFSFYGKKIKCTPDHKFYTDCGWKEVRSLIQSDILYTNEDIWLNTKKNRLKTGNQSSSIGVHTDDIQILKTALQEITFHPKVNISTELSGNSIMGKYPKGIIFITKMETSLTMIYPICNALLPLNTSDCMSKILDLISLRTQLEQLLRSGINQKKEEYGTESMQTICSLENGNQLPISATNVDPHIRLPNDQSLDFVQITVSLNGEETLDLMMSKETASIVVSSSFLTNMQNIDSVPKLAEEKPIGKQKVYDLSICEYPEFFADGILVHNSMDALRYCLYTNFGLRKNLKWGENNDDGRTLGGGRKF